MGILSGPDWKVWKSLILAFSCFLAAGLGYALATVLRRCDLTIDSSSAQVEPIITSAAENFLYDAGEVVAGTVVCHAFLVRNDWDEPIEIRKPGDIVIHCGCSSIEPADRRLAPGESTRIRVKLRTIGRVGTLANGGEVIWTATGGKQRKLIFTLRAEILRVLQVSDEILVFDDEAESGVITKELTFSSSKVPIIWESLCVTATSPFQITKVDKNSDRMHCVVTHPIESEREEVTGRIQAQARLQETKPDGGEIVTATVGVIWRPRQDDLRITPKMVPLAIGAEGRGKARLYLRGKKVEQNPKLIRSVVCEGHTVEWKLHPTAGGKAAILELNLIPTSGVKTPEKSLLSLDFRESGPVQVPFFVSVRKNEGTN